MRGIVPFLLGAAVIAPLYLGTPAHAQSLNDIQRLEERVERAKRNGDWGAASDLERQLNAARLQYQRAHGMGEVNDGRYGWWGNNNNGYYNPGYNGYYNPGNNGYYHPSNNGYYNRNNNAWKNKPWKNNNRNNRNAWQNRNGYYDQYGRWHNR